MLGHKAYSSLLDNFRVFYIGAFMKISYCICTKELPVLQKTVRESKETKEKIGNGK